jgi:hypothetical protein
VKEIASQVLLFPKENHPKSFQLLSGINFTEISSWQNFVLLTILQRHEAFQYIDSLHRPRGPKKGALLPSKDMALRQQIKDLIQT